MKLTYHEKQALKLCRMLEMYRDWDPREFRGGITDFQFLAENVMPKAETLKTGLQRKAAKE